MNQEQIGQSIIHEARSWVGTPWVHNTSVKKIGVDCVRLVEQCVKHLDVEFGVPEAYYRQPKDEQLPNMIRQLSSTVEINEIEAGCIGILKIYNLPCHVCIFTGNGTLIHASQRKGVVECGVGGWLDKIHSLYRVVKP